MSGIHDLLSIGRRALLAQQLGLQVTGNNIANAQNPSYSRQRLDMSAAPYLDRGTLILGSGVEVSGVQRMRDRIYDAQFWKENATLGRWDTAEKYASLVESVFNDLEGEGLSSSLDSFWNAWNELANHPEDPSMRRNILMRGEQLANSFKRIDAHLQNVRQQARNELAASVKQVNSLLQHIAQMNREISSHSTADSPNNTLLDERDKLLDELSKYVDVKITENENGTVTVFSNQRVLLDGDRAFSFTLKTSGAKGEDSYAIGLYRDNQEVELAGGKLRALLDLVQTEIPRIQNNLDLIAKQLVISVNNLHQANYTLNGETGKLFFAPQGVTAGSIQLSADVLQDISNIAVSKDGHRGDGSGALEISRLRSSKVMNDGISTINEAYASLVGDVGEFSQRMTTNLENQTSVVNMIQNQRQAAMGVNLEEEFVNMIRYQHAYGAAAKLISSVDEMMQTILSMVG